ncbi:hypothetical protein D3C84_801600 [compost metagenome]
MARDIPLSTRAKPACMKNTRALASTTQAVFSAPSEAACAAGAKNKAHSDNR